MANAIQRRKPDAGNSHIRFDGGEVAPAKPRRGSPLSIRTGIRGFLFVTSVCAFALVASAYTGAQCRWTGGGDGTTLNAGANWNMSGAVPGATDSAQFYTTGTLALTANADFPVGCASMQPNGGPLTVNLDLGGHLWNGNARADTWNYRFVAGGTAAYPLAVNITGGVISNMTSLSVGRQHDGGYYGGLNNTAFGISGAGTVFCANADTTGIGYGGTNNVLTVSDGAFFRSGREIIVGSGAAASNNLLHVTGAGTRMEMRPNGNESKIGNGGSYNEVLFENGAVVTKSQNGSTYLGYGTGAHDNRVTIRSGASASFSTGDSGSLLVGSSGGDNNTVVVSNGTLAAVSLQLGYSASGADGACGNKAYFGDGAMGNIANHLQVGVTALCDSNELHVAGAGTLLRTTNYDFSFGVNGIGNRTVVSDGATLRVKRCTFIGCSGNSDSLSLGTGGGNVLGVTGDGAVFHTVDNTVNVGGTNNAVIVSDGGTLVSASNMRLGAGAGSVSNELLVADASLIVSNQLSVGGYSNSSFNRWMLTGPDASAFLRCGLVIGGGNGANSNLVCIADGAVVTNAVYTTWDCKARVGNNVNAVGNRMIVSNATFYTHAKDELVVNGSGRGNVLEALDGAKVIVAQSFRCGSDATSCYGLIRAAGEGTVLTNTQYHLKVAGHNNGVSIEDGAKMYIQGEMSIFGSNDYVRIANGGFYNYYSPTLAFGNKAKLIWEGAKSKIRITALSMSEGCELEYVADKDGLADFGPVYETYLLKSDWTPTVKKIKVDVTEYLKANVGEARFTLLKSADNRTCRVVGTSSGGVKDQPAETIAAVNQAFRDMIEVTPADCVRNITVDMTKSKITLTVKRNLGLSIIFR